MLVKPSWLAPVLLFALATFPKIGAADVPGKLSETYGKLPLQFEENRVRDGRAVGFVAHGSGYSLSLASEEAVLVLDQSSATHEHGNAVKLRMSVVGARSTASVSGLDEFAGKANYFIGNDPSKWRTNVPTFARVRYAGVYSGIDLVYYGQQRQLEYDFVVAPGADPDQIVLGFEGADTIELDAQGDLVLHTGAGDVRQHSPVVYQETEGVRHAIDARYERKDPTRFGFKVAEYDRGRPLVIDPVISYSTYLGGSVKDFAKAIALDADGNVYVVGVTFSTDFPTTSGAGLSSTSSGNNVFVSKLNSTGTALLYSAYFGGDPPVPGLQNVTNDPYAVAIDSDHNVYVTGTTTSPSFPTTAGALKSAAPTASFVAAEAFVTKLNAAGSSLVYSTYLGNGGDVGTGIAVDGTGNAYVTGHTTSFNFPTTAEAFQRVRAGSVNAFLSKLDPLGGALVYSTYLGGSMHLASVAGTDGNGIAVDAMGEAYVVGVTNTTDFPTTTGAFQTVRRGSADAFVTKFNSTGSALVFSTYLGGAHIGSSVTPADAKTRASSVAIDASGNVYVTGETTASDFPVTHGAFQEQRAVSPNTDAFVTKLDPSGSTLIYSTYVGGSGDDTGAAIAVDIDGNAFVTGSTESTDFPSTEDACQLGYQGSGDAFVIMLNPEGSSTVYSTYLGGSGSDAGNGIAVDTGGNAYVAGSTGPAVPPEALCVRCTDGSDNFPTTPHAFQPAYGGGQGDGFVVKIAEPVSPMPPGPVPAATTSAPQMSLATTALADSGSQGAASGGGGAFDWLTLSALLAGVGLARGRRGER